VKPEGAEEEIIPGSIDDLIRRGELGMKVVPIDLAQIDAEEKKDGSERLD
jgi:hypothetical protein